MAKLVRLKPQRHSTADLMRCLCIFPQHLADGGLGQLPMASSSAFTASLVRPSTFFFRYFLRGIWAASPGFPQPDKPFFDNRMLEAVSIQAIQETTCRDPMQVIITYSTLNLRKIACAVGFARLAEETGFAIEVSHFPPRTSNWNRVDTAYSAALQPTGQASAECSYGRIVGSARIIYILRHCRGKGRIKDQKIVSIC